MLKTIIITLSCVYGGLLFAYEGDTLFASSNPVSSTSNDVSTSDSEPETDKPLGEVDISNIYDVKSQKLNDSVQLFYVDDIQLYHQGWNELAQPYFWQTIMNLSPDSCVINVAASRQIISIMSLKDYDRYSDKEKDAMRDSIRVAHNLDSNATIYRTIGKKDFYDYGNILETISKGVEAFKNQGVDPWYAQAILMIECPGKLARSSAGAYGSFQLMPFVARKFGLTVSRHLDERKDFDKSAIAASKMISTVCIPEAKSILNRYNISYNESDLWFRLFVMHIYNAGAGNVSSVVNKIAPTEGGMQLIQTMWVTQAGSFKNASQNYSQLTLAAMMILDKMLWGCYS